MDKDMKNLKINFTDFWGGFDKKNNYFYNIFSEKYNLIIDENPDILIYSIFGNNHTFYNCIKIFYTGENIPPNFNECDYSYSFDYLKDKRNYRLPLYILYGGYEDLINKKVNEDFIKKKFCNFMVSNGSCQIRNNFFNELSKYKKVDSGGGYLNNIGFIVKNKVEFQSQYKFSIAFENDAYRFETPGYTTEKIFEPMTVNSIPLYWGNPKIDLEFNSKSFINYYDFNNFKDMIDYIIYLDENDDKYYDMLKEPWLINNELLENNKQENIIKFFDNIILNHFNF